MVVRFIILCLNMLVPVSKSLCNFSRNLSLGKITFLPNGSKPPSIIASCSGMRAIDEKVSCNEEFENFSSNLLDVNRDCDKLLDEVFSSTDSPLGRQMALERRGDCFSRLLLRGRLPRSLIMIQSSFLHSGVVGTFPWDGREAVDCDLWRCSATTALELPFTSLTAQSCLRKPLLLFGREQLLLRKSFLTRTGA
jgi:hypothetical protein